MSWSQRIHQFGGRWSPFARSPTTENGTAQVRDQDFSYITAEDLKNGDYDRNSKDADTDVIIFRYGKQSYQIHFPVHSIDRAELTIKDVREQVAKKIGLDVSRIRLSRRGRKLSDDTRTCREEALSSGCELLCMTSDSSNDDTVDSDSDDDTAEGSADPEQTKRKRNRTRNKKKKGKKRGGLDTNDPESLAVPAGAGVGSGPSRGTSPKPPPTPATPADKLNVIYGKLQELMPECRAYISQPPADKAKRDFDHKRLGETVLAQVLLKLDAVETDEPELRARRKALVKEAQEVLNSLDAAKGS